MVLNKIVFFISWDLSEVILQDSHKLCQSSPVFIGELPLFHVIARSIPTPFLGAGLASF